MVADGSLFKFRTKQFGVLGMECVCLGTRWFIITLKIIQQHSDFSIFTLKSILSFVSTGGVYSAKLLSSSNQENISISQQVGHGGKINRKTSNKAISLSVCSRSISHQHLNINNMTPPGTEYDLLQYFSIYVFYHHTLSIFLGFKIIKNIHKYFF